MTDRRLNAWISYECCTKCGAHIPVTRAGTELMDSFTCGECGKYHSPQSSEQGEINMKGYEIWTKEEVMLAWSEVYDNMGFPESKRKVFMKTCEEIVDKIYKEVNET